MRGNTKKSTTATPANRNTPIPEILISSLFGVYTPSWLEISISGIGVFLFAGVAVVDFFVLPRTYNDEQYLPAALSMYLTYINLFIFILRLLIAINSRD